MSRIVLYIIIAFTMKPIILYQFTTSSDRSDWTVIDDVVMGGISSGNFYINKAGKGVFEGRVSLENNGGFSSLRCQLNKEVSKQHTMLALKIKGDGKKYQFRIKEKTGDYHSYVAYFESSTTWQTIKIPLSSMYPAFRGRKLNIPNYNGDRIAEIAFLIGNKKEENFKLEIDFIALE